MYIRKCECLKASKELLVSGEKKENNEFFTVFLGVKVKEGKFPWYVSASDKMKRILDINKETEEAFLEELIKALEDESTNPDKEIYEEWSHKYSVESV